MDWDKAEECFQRLLSDNSLSDEQKGSVELYYATMILYNPSLADTSALRHFNNAISYKGYLESVDDYCAYAYLLGCLGDDVAANRLFENINLSDYKSKYSFHYWKHRLYKQEGDFKNAYYSLWSSRQIADSVSRVHQNNSAADAYRTQMEELSIIRRLELLNQRRLIVVISLLAVLAAAVTGVLISRMRRKSVEERDRMEISINSLNSQVINMKTENEELIKEKSRAKFEILASLFEDVYHLEDKNSESTKEKLYDIINERTRVLRNDEKAQIEFERLLNEESDNIMESFREDYPDLKPNEYHMASCVFAGFDNTTIMLILGIKSLEYTRVQKNRLKTKIQKQSIESSGRYLVYFK